MSVVRLPCRNWASPANDMRAQSRFTHMQSDSRPPLGQGIGRARGKHVHITWQILHTALAILLGYACIEYSRLSNSLSLSLLQNTLYRNLVLFAPNLVTEDGIDGGSVLAAVRSYVAGEGASRWKEDVERYSLMTEAKKKLAAVARAQVKCV